MNGPPEVGKPALARLYLDDLPLALLLQINATRVRVSQPASGPAETAQMPGGIRVDFEAGHPGLSSVSRGAAMGTTERMSNPAISRSVALVIAVVVLALAALAVAVLFDAPVSVWILAGIAVVASLVSYAYGTRADR